MDEDLSVFVPLTCVDSRLVGKYEINKLGHIRNTSTGKIRNNIKGVGGNYPRVSFRSGSNFKIDYPVHILVAKTFIPNPDNKPEVDHIDRDINNYHVDNLRWVTREENLANRSDTRRKGLALARLDDNENEVERILYKDLDVVEVGRICSAIRSGSRHDGYYWKRINLDVEEYINIYGSPLDEDWKESNRCSGLFCNKNGLLKIGDKLTPGSKSTNGYRTISYKGTKYFVHRLIYETFNGCLLKNDEIIDHINTKYDDNRLMNLRKVSSQKENMNNETTKLKVSKPVSKYSITGEFLSRYNSLRDATKEQKDSRNKLILEGSNDNTIQLCCEEKTLTAFGYLWCYTGKEETIERKLGQLILRYDKNHNLVNGYKSYNSVGGSNNSYKARIKKSIETGQLCSDGFYYSRGPRKFD